jgi:hypothetical protein
MLSNFWATFRFLEQLLSNFLIFFSNFWATFWEIMSNFLDFLEQLVDSLSLCRYAIQRKFIGRLGNFTLNFTRKTDIGLKLNVEFPCSTNEFTYNINTLEVVEHSSSQRNTRLRLMFLLNFSRALKLPSWETVWHFIL